MYCSSSHTNATKPSRQARQGSHLACGSYGALRKQHKFGSDEGKVLLYSITFGITHICVVTILTSILFLRSPLGTTRSRITARLRSWCIQTEWVRRLRHCVAVFKAGWA